MGSRVSIFKVTKRGLVCILVSVLGLAIGQEPQAPVSNETGRRPAALPAAVEPSSTKIHVDSDLVVVPVTVTDSKGRIVPGLQKEHFTLYEDKVEQAITHFAAEDAPVSICLVFDTSDSMGPKLRKAQEAVAALLRNANREDEFCLVEFNHYPRLVVGMTRQGDEILNQAAVVRTSGSTALLDAVIMAMNEMTKAHHVRKALIIISDGEDNSSRCTVSELKKAVREADVLIYAVGLVDADVLAQSWGRNRFTGSALLNEIATQTGGRLFVVNKLKQLPDIASKIGTWLRNQYVLAYSPNNPEKDGRYRRLQVKLTAPKGFPHLHASWRLGYYAPTE
jgi:VWFA-related protein